MGDSAASTSSAVGRCTLPSPRCACGVSARAAAASLAFERASLTGVGDAGDALPDVPSEPRSSTWMSNAVGVAVAAVGVARKGVTGAADVAGASVGTVGAIGAIGAGAEGMGADADVAVTSPLSSSRMPAPCCCNCCICAWFCAIDS
eukprot:7377838-Prymnesium_polylepis.2